MRTSSTIFDPALAVLAGSHRVMKNAAPGGSSKKNAKKRHTSEITVAVFEERRRQQTVVRSEDLRIETFKGSGPGGQSVNTTDSAVRITHVPSGIVVTASEQRSQHQNRVKAISRLEERLAEINARREHEATNAVRQVAVEDHRSWVWRAWTDEVRGPGGLRGSMKRVLRGKMQSLVS